MFTMLLLSLDITPSAHAEFGIAAFDGQVTANGTGDAFTQAGGHPYALSVNMDFNSRLAPIPPNVGLFPWPDEAVKDVSVDAPPGLIGNPTGTAQCTLDQLSVDPATSSGTLCPAASQVGVTTITLPLPHRPGDVYPLGPLGVFNMVTPPEATARFGFRVLGTVVLLDASVRSTSDYGVTINLHNINEGVPILRTNVTFWGVPADPSHDSERFCPGGDVGCTTEAEPKAFLTLPTACPEAGTGLKTIIHADSWDDPGDFKTASFTSHLSPAYPSPPAVWGPVQGPTGCDQVPFKPVFKAAPTDRRSPGPSGWTFDLSVPQDTIGQPDAIAEGHVKKVVVTLPKGVRVSPSAADKLEGCSPAQIGLDNTNDPTCPGASKVGTLRIDTPLLQEPLEGAVYLATPHQNPSNSLLALYIVAKGPGLIVKLPGSVQAAGEDGQLSATFDDNPQLPFSNLHIEFFGGSRASLSNPPRCGTYTTHATLTSWSGKTVSSDSSFATSRDGRGAPCPAPRFSPGFEAGTEDPVSGVFTPFSLRLQRTDDDNEFRSLSSLSLPKGLLADVGSVSTRCTEDQARAAACPVASHIGTVLTGAGAGPDPFYVPGDVYLMGGFSSGPFKGDPFGLAVVVHAVAGPFDLGYVVVEAGIQVHDDGSITTQTEPFPSILEGIPLQLKDVRVSLDRPHFILNPTNCDQMGIAGTVTSTEGQSAGVFSRFQVGECANLAFKPSFTVSTTGRTSKANGASLHVHVGTHQGPGSTGTTRESNIAKVDVQLPVVLPARLPTLQKACTAAQFGADPAGCPVGSFVGTAIAHTPILASPLSGPAILVSHGGEAFPDLVLVLQGEGVRINLTGHTQIKKGITYNHFETIPDAPVSSFDLTLPAGPHGVLTTDIPGRNLCATTRTVTVTKRVTRRVNGHTRRVTVKAKKAVAAPLLMPTTMTAQNGVVIHQNTKIAVTGCAAVKTKGKKATTKKGARKK